MSWAVQRALCWVLEPPRMGGSAVVMCDSCGFVASVMYGPGRAMIEFVPCVCRACQDVVTIQRIYTWTDPTGVDVQSESELAEIEQRLGVPRDPPLVCPDCSQPVKPLLRRESELASAVEPCPRCGEALSAEWGGLEWD